MRGAIVALLAIFMLLLSFFVGLSVNPLQPAATKVVTSTMTVTASLTTIEAVKKTTTWLKGYVSITEKVTKTITEKTTQTVTATTTSYITLPRTATVISTTTLTSHTTLTSTITLTETATTYVKSTSTITSIVYTTKTVTTTKTAESIQIEGAEVDLVATVYKVVDGDTFDAFPSGRVRLADINAPELGEEGGQEAKEALINLVLNKKVYLDVDDLYVMDRYNRLICVVFVDYNSTHVLNVNKWLIESGYAQITDYENEFDPNMWTLYNRKM